MKKKSLSPYDDRLLCFCRDWNDCSLFLFAFLAGVGVAVVLNAEFGFDGSGDGVLVDNDVHGLVADKGLAGIEHAVVVAIIAQ